MPLDKKAKKAVIWQRMAHTWGTCSMCSTEDYLAYSVHNEQELCEACWVYWEVQG